MTSEGQWHKTSLEKEKEAQICKACKPCKQVWVSYFQIII